MLSLCLILVWLHRNSVILCLMYHIEVWPSFAQQQCLQQAAQCGDFTDVNLANCLGTMFQYKLQTFLHILFKQLQQVSAHWLWNLRRQKGMEQELSLQRD